jgi:hypothetical protein
VWAKQDDISLPSCLNKSWDGLKSCEQLIDNISCGIVALGSEDVCEWSGESCVAKKLSEETENSSKMIIWLVSIIASVVVIGVVVLTVMIIVTIKLRKKRKLEEIEMKTMTTRTKTFTLGCLNLINHYIN